MMLADAGNSEPLRLAAYMLAAGACLFAWRWECVQRSVARRDFYPAFWAWSALLLLAIAMLRASGLVESIADLGRDQAHAGGWYEQRRPLQAAMVAVMASAWILSTFLTVWRIPERRRRYLSFVLVTLSIVFFGAIRLVSLHHIDTVLYGTDVAGVRVVAWIEVGACFVAVAVVCATLFRHRFASQPLHAGSVAP
jgi:hypothetical protein